MPNTLEDKQLIIITGSEGAKEVFDISTDVLTRYQKSFIAFKAGEEDKISIGNEPVAIVLCEDNELTNYAHHIALITNIRDIKDGSFEERVGFYEKMLDGTPKAGSIVYHEDDNISAVICKKERLDVTTSTFSTPAIKHNNEESIFKIDKEEIILKDCDENKALSIKAAYALLKILRVSEKDFINILEK
ncbi:MAG: hypothetical protein AAFO69_14000 [Bacteroidota bacterium]